MARPGGSRTKGREMAIERWRRNVRSGTYSWCEFSMGVLLVVICVFWQDAGRLAYGQDRAPNTVAELHRPTRVPDRILLSLPDDPATTMAVTWRTSSDVTEGYAELLPAAPEPLNRLKPERYVAETQPLTTDLGVAHYHTVIFRSLRPKTTYAYRVGDGVHWSAWQHFSTAGQADEPFTFIYLGDAQNDIEAHWSRVVREAFRTAPRAAFILHAGDLINHWNRDAEWGEWHRAAGWINGTIPSIAAAGNHEYGGLPPLTTQLTPNWRAQFAFPTNGPSGLEETVYTVDYQTARIVVLNSNLRWQEQASWMEGVLSGHGRPWTIVTMHHPVFAARPGRANPLLLAYWKPVFDRHRVDLVLQGHDHSYVRSGLVGAADGGVTSDKTEQPAREQSGAEQADVAQRQFRGGTVYVISVSGPKMYDLGWQPHTRRAARNTQMYQIIHVTQDQLHFEARMADGVLYDAFTLRKRPGQGNELIECIPQVPDRR
jgi:hypothetical protein